VDTSVYNREHEFYSQIINVLKILLFQRVRLDGTAIANIVPEPEGADARIFTFLSPRPSPDTA